MCLDIGGHGDDVHKNLVETWQVACSCYPKLIQSLPGGVQGRALKEHVGQITLHREAGFSKTVTQSVCWCPVPAEVVRAISTRDHLCNDMTFRGFKTVAASKYPEKAGFIQGEVGGFENRERCEFKGFFSEQSVPVRGDILPDQSPEALLGHRVLEQLQRVWEAVLQGDIPDLVEP